MDARRLALLIRRATRTYVVADLIIGPTLVGAVFLGFAVWVLAVAAVWRLGVPWPIGMVAVGVIWVGTAWATFRAVRWELGLLVRRG